MAGGGCILTFENIDVGLNGGYIDVYFEINAEPEPRIPAFNLFILMAVISIIVIREIIYINSK